MPPPPEKPLESPWKLLEDMETGETEKEDIEVGWAVALEYEAEPWSGHMEVSEWPSAITQEVIALEFIHLCILTHPALHIQHFIFPASNFLKFII